MKKRLILLAGLGVGFILGSRTGRQSYEKLKAQVQELWSDPRVQDTVDRANQTIRDRAPAVAEAVQTATERVTAAAESVGAAAAEARAEDADSSRADGPGDEVEAPADSVTDPSGVDTFVDEGGNLGEDDILNAEEEVVREAEMVTELNGDEDGKPAPKAASKAPAKPASKPAPKPSPKAAAKPRTAAHGKNPDVFGDPERHLDDEGPGGVADDD